MAGGAGSYLRRAMEFDGWYGRKGWGVSGGEGDGQMPTHDLGRRLFKEGPILILQPFNVELAGGFHQKVPVREGNRFRPGKPGSVRLLREAGLNRLENPRPEFGGRELHGRQCWVKKALFWGQASYPRNVEKSICARLAVGKPMAEQGFRG